MMLLTVLVLSSVIAIVTTLATLLISFQLRQVTDAQASGQAIFAADTGIECIIFKKFGTPGATTTCPEENREFTLPGGAKFTFALVRRDGNNETWLSVGKDKNGRVARALQIRFVQQ